MENLCVFLSFIENDDWYQSKLFSNDKNIYTIYRDIISLKFKHLFFIEVPHFNDRYISTYYNIETPRLMNRDFLSSIEPIRPVRWLDKIKAYAEKLKSSENERKNGGLIKIAAIGYVNLRPDGENCVSSELEMFYKTLCKIRTEDFDCKYDFEVNIYPNSNDKYFTELVQNSKNYSTDEPAGVLINIEFSDYSKFFVPNDSEGLNAVIKKHDVVLLEDVPNIYTHEYKLLKKSGRVFPDNNVDSSYESEYERMDFKHEDFLTLNFKYSPIYFLTSKLNLISMNEDVYEDTLKYKLNLSLINYLRGYVDHLSNAEQEHNVYIFTSKKSGVEFSDYVQDNFTREERYNAKNFYLISLSNRGDKKLQAYPEGRKKSFVVFSLWNMLKNIDYSFIESEAFYRDIMHCDKEEVCSLAMKIYIKMKWDFPNNSFCFEFCYDSEFDNRDTKPDKELLCGFLRSLFKIIFSSKKNLFTRCIRRSFFNVVYSQMEYIEDAVFYCVLCSSSFENINLQDVHYSDFVERYVYSVNQPVFWNLTNILKLLSEKDFREDAVWEINRLFENNYGFYSAAKLDTPNDLIQRVKKICEEYGCTTSSIYSNSVNLLK